MNPTVRHDAGVASDFEQGFREGCRACATTIRQGADIGEQRGALDSIAAKFLRELADTFDPKKQGGTNGD